MWTGPVFPNGSFPDLNVTEDCGDPDGVLSPGGTGCLFDLEADPYEHTNLATSLPATVRALRTIIASAQQGVFQPLRGTQQTAAMCAAAFGRYGGFLGPFVGL